MTLHRTSGRWRLGLLLALATALLWASLPVALKVALESLDPWTLTWFRFALPALLMGIWLAWRGHLGGFHALAARGWTLLVVAALTLTSNYVFYLFGLNHTTPANAQLLIQLAPLLMAFGGIFLFKERFAGGQWLGLGIMVLGLLLFFRDQLEAGGERYAGGALLIVIAALCWAAYALAQKQLLVSLRSTAVMGFIYAAATLLLWPMADPSSLLRLDLFHAAALTYSALNTLAAYGAFSEALAHWEASRVSAVLALTPLLTVLTMELALWIAPGLIAPERIALSGWIGAGLVVTGSMLVSVLALQGRAIAGVPRSS